MKREISCEWLTIRPLHWPVFYKLCKQLGLPRSRINAPCVLSQVRGKMRLVRPVSPNICSNFQGVGVLSLKYILLDEGYRDYCSHASWREYPDNLDPWIPHRGRFLIRQHQLWWNVRRVLVSCDLIRTSTFGISKRVAQISKSGGLQICQSCQLRIIPRDPIWLENIRKNVIETVGYLWKMLNDVSFDSEMEVSAWIISAVFHLM